MYQPVAIDMNIHLCRFMSIVGSLTGSRLTNPVLLSVLGSHPSMRNLLTEGVEPKRLASFIEQAVAFKLVDRLGEKGFDSIQIKDAAVPREKSSEG